MNSDDSTQREEAPLTDPEPEVGEVRRLTNISWDPWVLVTRVESDSDGNRVARFAVLDKMDDDVLTSVPDGWFAELETSVGDRPRRRELAEAVDGNDDIDKRWCPVDRLAILGDAGIQGCDSVSSEAT